MKRLTILDGMRGWFLVTMTISHIILNGDVWVKEAHFARVMFVESAQGFIFLAGLLAGILLTSKLSKNGFESGARWAAGRVVKLWIVSVGMILGAMYLRQYLPDGAWVFRNWLGFSGPAETSRAIAVATLAYQPTFMDILPQYILYLAAAPALVWLVMRGHWPLVAGLSLIAWLSVQLGLWMPMGQAVNAALEAHDGQGLRMAFQPAAWQIAFVTGLILGTLWRAGKLDPDRFFPETSHLALGVAVVLAFFVPLRILTAHGWLPNDVLNVFAQMETRRTFGPVYLVSFLSAAWLLGWTLYRGGATGIHWLDRFSHGLRGILSWRLAEVMGRHSMLIYVWHVVLVYGLYYIDSFGGPFDVIGRNVMSFVVLMLLPLPALFLEHQPQIMGAQKTQGS